MVTPEDARIEGQVKSEDIKELVELREARVIIERAISKGKNYTNQELIKNIDGAARLVLDAKTHNDRLRALSSRLWKDLVRFRGGATSKYLTGEERKILAVAQGISVHLANLATNIEYAKNIYIKMLNIESTGAKPFYIKLSECKEQLEEIILTIESLFMLERQLEQSINRAGK